MNDTLMENNDVDTLILGSVEKWLERDVRPHVLHFDHGDEYLQEMAEQMKELGLFGVTISEEYGGLGLSATTYAKVIEKNRRKLDVADGHYEQPSDYGFLCHPDGHRGAKTKILAKVFDR